MPARPRLSHAARTVLTVTVSLAALLAGLAWFTPAASADTGTAPVITSEVDADGDGVGDATVSGVHTLTAATDQPYVMFVVWDGAPASYGVVSQLAAATDGTASYDWPTWGFGSQPATVVVRGCSDITPASCGNEPDASLELHVDNPVASFTAPDTAVFTDPDAPADPDNPAVVVDVTDAPDADGALFVRWGGPDGRRYPVTGDGSPTTLTFPGVAYGTGTLDVVRCNPGNVDICASASGPSAEVTVRRTFQPRAYLTPGQVLSPNGDGNHESLTAGVSLDDATDSVATWTLVGPGGLEVAMTPQPISVSTTGGPTNFTVDPYAAGLTHLAPGNYRVRVLQTGTDHGRTFTGTTTSTDQFLVDLQPAVVTFTPSVSTFYPYGDGYLDVVQVRTGVVGDGGYGTVDVINDRDKAVAHIANVPLFGSDSFTWNGTMAPGRFAPAGRYRFRVTLTDNAGNTGTSVGGPVTLSLKRLQWKTWTKTVSAASSGVENDSGRCSSLRVPGTRLGKGSVGYYSASRCKGSRKDQSQWAVGVHALKVPAAHAYGQVAISVYGAETRKGSRSVAALNWVNKTGHHSPGVATLSPQLGWHNGGHRDGAKMVQTGRWLVWAVVVAYGERYDVSRFKATVHYQVLA